VLSVPVCQRASVLIIFYLKVTTMTSRILSALLWFMLSVSVQAQVYKWVDADGKITYSDVPPPKTAVKVETKSFSSSDTSNVALPFELAQAAKSMPVVLYTADSCVPCNDGRNFLKQNGIPFSEKTVASNADQEKLHAISGGSQLPFLLIGRTKMTGYSFSEWRASLSQAGYPESSMLPADYQYPAPQPAAPVAAVTKNNNAPTAPAPAPTPTAQPQDSNAFQF